MKKQITLTLTFVMLGTFLFAQHEFDKWIFGNGVGFDFTSGTPTVITSNINGWDNSASIADSTGTLLFFCNGITIQDRNGNVMPNGNGILGDTSGGQAATIVRKPGSENLYYVFTNVAFGSSDGFRYTVVDMNLNGGMGDVDAANKNIQILTPNTEKVVPVVHANGSDVWIICHEWGNNVFRAYLLTANGLLPNYISSSTGSIHTASGNNSIGQLTVTKAGDKIACAIYDNGAVDICKFNNLSGVISDPITITGYSNAIGLEFSPDGSKLYETGLLATDIVQFNLSTYTQTAVSNSATTVGIIPATWATYRGGYLMLGPDDKIYVAQTFNNKVGRINSPNTTGNSCNYDGNAINLGTATIDAGLVDKIAVTKVNCATQIINGITIHTDTENRIKIFPNPTTGMLNIVYDSNKNFDLIIYDVLGREIIHRKNEQQQALINLSAFIKGTYLIKIIDVASQIEITKRIELQ